jgi:hypothetical protein
MVAPKFEEKLAVYSGITKSLVEALQKMLLNLAEAENG